MWILCHVGPGLCHTEKVWQSSDMAVLPWDYHRLYSYESTHLQSQRTSGFTEPDSIDDIDKPRRTRPHASHTNRKLSAGCSATAGCTGTRQQASFHTVASLDCKLPSHTEAEIHERHAPPHPRSQPHCIVQRDRRGSCDDADLGGLLDSVK